VMLFPSSPTVLCVAPGGHIEIEDMDAPCCAHSGISAPAACQPGSGFNGPNCCHNCTDYFMTPNGPGAISESYDAVAIPFVGECLETHISTEISLSLCRSDALTNIAATIAVSSSVPLRC
jgi:hypothetical protein